MAIAQDCCQCLSNLQVFGRLAQNRKHMVVGGWAATYTYAARYRQFVVKPEWIAPKDTRKLQVGDFIGNLNLCHWEFCMRGACLANCFYQGTLKTYHEQNLLSPHHQSTHHTSIVASQMANRAVVRDDDFLTHNLAHRTYRYDSYCCRSLKTSFVVTRKVRILTYIGTMCLTTLNRSVPSNDIDKIWSLLAILAAHAAHRVPFAPNPARLSRPN